MLVPQIDYVSILMLFACVSFFVKGAQLEGRSAIVWGGLSLGAWLVASLLARGGTLAALSSQVLLFIGLTAYACWRERRAANVRRES